MSHRYIFYNFHAEIQRTGSRSEVTVNLERSSAVSQRPRDAQCRWTFCRHSKSLKFIRI